MGTRLETRAVKKALNELMANEKLQKAVIEDLKGIILEARVRQVFSRSIEMLKNELIDLNERIGAREKKLTELDKAIASKKAEYEKEVDKFKGLVSPQVLARLKGHRG